MWLCFMVENILKNMFCILFKFCKATLCNITVTNHIYSDTFKISHIQIWHFVFGTNNSLHIIYHILQRWNIAQKSFDPLLWPFYCVFLFHSQSLSLYGRKNSQEYISFSILKNKESHMDAGELFL